MVTVLDCSGTPRSGHCSQPRLRHQMTDYFYGCSMGSGLGSAGLSQKVGTWSFAAKAESLVDSAFVAGDPLSPSSSVHFASQAAHICSPVSANWSPAASESLTTSHALPRSFAHYHCPTVAALVSHSHPTVGSFHPLIWSWFVQVSLFW